MPKSKRRRSWLVPAIVALVLFVGNLTSNLVTSDMGDFVARFRPWLWLVTVVAGLVAVGAAIRDARQPTDEATDGRQAADAYSRRRGEYLGRIVKQFQFLPLAPVDYRSASAETGENERVRLPDVYVALDTTTARDKRAGRDAALVESGSDTERLSVLQALVDQRRLVLVGEPGSGKSTFVNYLAFILAADLLEPRNNWIARLDPWPETWHGLLPVPVALRDMAAWFQATQHHQRKAGLFYAYLEHWMSEIGIDDFYEPLCSHLHDGTALLLLDGLDELSLVDDVLSRVKEAIADLLTALPATSIVVTCRVLSYSDPRWRLEGNWPVFELARLRGDQIDGFIDAWYNQLSAMGMATKPGPLSAKLKHAVRRPDLQELAPNPLLLTVMALVHTFKGELPDARAQLYEDVVDLLLWRWESTKAQEDDSGAIGLRQMLATVGQRDIDLKQILWQLAYGAHAQASEERAGAIAADIPKAVLLEALRDLHPDRSLDWAEQMVLVMQRRAGLLVERMPDVFTFPHRTFQEYLAGCHLSVLPEFIDRVLELAKQGAFWRTVILLAVGRLSHVNGDAARPLMLVSELCPEAPPVGGDETGWRDIWLAGDCLLEIGLPSAKRRKLGSVLVERVRQQLLLLITTDQLQPRERAEAGSTLGAIGDPRDFDEMMPVPAGQFLMGSDKKKDSLASNGEMPQHEVPVGAFRIGRYPVTNEQYARFVAATGHRAPSLWNGISPPERLRNHPVVTVSWRDAQAYCTWLSNELGSEVRLPTEAEWEKAARGTDENIYPWGNDFGEGRCNSAEARIGGTSPVGIFQCGASSYDLLDMAGNVWEWTSSKYQPYPYNADDGRENPEGDDGRALRGGSFRDSRRLVRCACRVYADPNNRNSYFGFRVMSPGS